MTDQSADLVTKIDVEPDLTGLKSFEAGIDRVTKKVDKLGAAIRHVNNLSPKSPYAPTSTRAGAGVSTPATVAAVSAIAAGGGNLVSRLPVGRVVAQEMKKIQSAIATGGGGGGFLPPPGSFGGFLPSPGGRRGGFFPDTSAGSFSGTPLDPKNRTPVARGVRRGMGNPFGPEMMLGGAGLTAGMVAAWNSVSASLDSITSQENQLARLPQTVGSASDAFLRLNQAASDTKTDAGAFISTYSNIATATAKLGLSEKEATEATQGLTSALALGGGSSQAVTNALYQMGQAFSSNKFAGDEFRSFMEAIGTMAPEVAKAFGTDVAGLRAMSEQGKLTAEVVVNAFRKMAANNLDLLKKQGWTWGQVTTVMTNDWNAFLAQATIGGDWQRFTDWAAKTLIPMARKAEKAVAQFWVALTDESKTAILIGILGTLGAAFTALAIPVLSATWPFLAIGAAVWILYETFVELKAWMDGEGGTIFDSLFGPLDRLKQEYQELFWLLEQIQKVIEFLGNAPGAVVQGQQSFINNLNRPASDLGGIMPAVAGGAADAVTGAPEGISGIGEFLLNGIKAITNTEGILTGSNVSASQSKGVTNVNNSGNKTTYIQVSNADQAAQVANGLSDPGTISELSSQNIAEGTGAR